MTAAYILKLVIVLPLVAALAFGSLYFWRKVQPRLGLGRGERHVKMVDTIPLGATAKLAVVEFGSKRLLLSVARGKVALVSEKPIAEFAIGERNNDGD